MKQMLKVAMDGADDISRIPAGDKGMGG
jgi:hypothetical protein